MFKAIRLVGFGTRVLKHWVLGPSGIVISYNLLMTPNDHCGRDHWGLVGRYCELAPFGRLDGPMALGCQHGMVAASGGRPSSKAPVC